VTENSTPRRPNVQENHTAASQSPEQHLLDSHQLSIQLQGKMGPTGSGVWALVRLEKGKTKTLTVHEGTHQEAVVRFYRYIHPDQTSAAQAAARRLSSPRPRSQPPTRRPAR
jgi:hypothetical protein